MTDAATLFPYPDDDPGQITAEQDTFRQLATSVGTIESQLGSDLTVLKHSWTGDAADACGAEVAGSRKVVASTARALADVATALTPYLRSVEDARAAIDALRRDYDRELTVHNRRVAAAGPLEPSVPDLPSISTALAEDAAWQRTSQALRVRYEDCVSEVTRVARRTRTELEKIGERVGEVRPGQPDLARAVEFAVSAELPMTRRRLDAQAAAVLLRKAAAGDTAALRELARCRAEAADPEFATTLADLLGPKGLLDLPGQLVLSLMHAKISGADAWAAARNNNAAILRFLSDVLATSTTMSNYSHVPSEWVTALQREGRATHNLTDPHGAHYYGYWSLAQILRAAGPAPPYSTEFMFAVGRDLMAWVRSASGTASIAEPFGMGTGNFNEPGVPSDDRGNVGAATSGLLIGLLHASATSPGAAQALLDTTPPGEKTSNLDYLLHRPGRWWSDTGNALGDSLEAAASGPEPEAAKISAMAVHLYADVVQHDVSVNDDGTVTVTDVNLIPGLRDNLARVLAHHIDDVNDAILRTEAPTAGVWVDVGHAQYGRNDLAYVLLDAERDAAGYNTMLAAQLGYVRQDIDSAASTSGDYSYRILQVRGRAGDDAKVLGFLLEARGQGLQGAARALDEANGQLADFATRGLGLIELPTAIAEGPTVAVTAIAAAHAGAFLTDWTRTHHVEQAYADSATYRSATDTIVRQMLESTVVKHDLWPPGHAPVAGADTASFMDSTTGKIISLSTMTTHQYNEFQIWAHTSGTIPDLEQQTTGLQNDGAAQYKDQLGLKN